MRFNPGCCWCPPSGSGLGSPGLGSPGLGSPGVGPPVDWFACLPGCNCNCCAPAPPDTLYGTISGADLILPGTCRFGRPVNDGTQSCICGDNAADQQSWTAAFCTSLSCNLWTYCPGAPGAVGDCLATPFRLALRLCFSCARNPATGLNTYNGGGLAFAVQAQQSHAIGNCPPYTIDACDELGYLLTAGRCNEANVCGSVRTAGVCVMSCSPFWAQFHCRLTLAAGCPIWPPPGTALADCYNFHGNPTGFCYGDNILTDFWACCDYHRRLPGPVDFTVVISE